MTRAAWAALLDPSAVKLPQGKVRRVAPLEETESKRSLGIRVTKRCRANREALRAPGLLVLPWPPTVNTYWRATRMGLAKPTRFYVTRQGQAYRRTVYVEAQRQSAPRLGKSELAVHVQAYPPDARLRDLDNILKALLDAIAHAGCYDNDIQIAELSVKRMARGYNGAVVVRMEAL